MYQTKQWLERAVGLLERSQVPSARLDALILLEDALGHDRAYLLAHPELEVGEKAAQQLEKQLLRRGAHEPLAYIRGRSEFYGRGFRVTPATLQPRPETETMIELLLHHVLGSKGSEVQSIVDVGTGSGCLAITAKLERPELELYATEINTNALTVARENAQKLGADVTFYQGNLLQPVSGLKSPVLSSFAILANLPYVPDDHTINQAAMQEPKVAIFGGEDGLDLYREMFAQVNSLKTKPLYILTESLPFQHQELAGIAENYSYSLYQTRDLIQVFETSG